MDSLGANEVGANEVGANEVGANEVGANEVNTFDTLEQVVMRQTDYTYEQAKLQLQLHNNDVTKVIRSYLKNGTILYSSTDKALSLNQQIYKEIRNLLHEDDLTKHSKTMKDIMLADS
jgi:hypothetical protein